jgi:hypothetical protein
MFPCAGIILTGSTGLISASRVREKHPKEESQRYEISQFVKMPLVNVLFFGIISLGNLAMKQRILLILTVISFLPAYGQIYFHGIGLKAGKFNSGLTYKHFFDADNATGMQIDLCYTHIADDGLTLKGFYLRQKPFKVPIIQLPLDLVYGAGLHVGYFPIRTTGYYKIVNEDPVFYNKDVVTIGLDATIQIEYKIPLRNVPFTVTFDCTPFYEIVNRGPEWIDFGLAIRYVFR